MLRLKENADDYRYFPDPDLVPLRLDGSLVEAVRRALPELADARRERFRSQYGLSEYDALQLTASRALADFFEAGARLYGEAKPVANWLLRDVLAALAAAEREIEAAAITPEALVALLRLVDAGRTTPASARSLVPELVESGGDPEALVRERGLEAVADAGRLEAAVDAVLAEHPASVAQFRAGEPKVVHFLMGQVMRRMQGKADPAGVREILLRRLHG